jgi:hypothetical protein
MNAGCHPGPGFSACMVENLDLYQPNFQKDGYWPILDDANSDFLRDDVNMNVDKWWDPNADAGASIATFKQRRNSPSADPDYAMKSVKTQSLRFVPGVGVVESGSSVEPNAKPAASPLPAVKDPYHTGQEQRAMEAADAALGEAGQQLSKEAGQKQQQKAEQNKYVHKQQMLRKLEGKKMVQALDADSPLSKAQKENMLVQELHRMQNDKNFRTSGYVPFLGNSRALQVFVGLFCVYSIGLF